MTRPMRVLALVALGLVVPACNVIAGLTDEYRVAGGAGAEGGAVDGDKDGALADGFVPGQDGGADASVDQLVPASFCETLDKTGVDFCEDFEKGASTATTTVWTAIENSHAATISVVDMAGLNETSRGLDINSMSASTSSRNIILHKTLPLNKPVGDYLQYDVELDVKLIDSTDDYVALGVLNFTNATPEDHGVAAYPSDGVIGRLTPKTIGASPAKKAWQHVHIKLSRGAAGATLNRTITVGAAATVVDNMTNLSSAGTTLTEIRIGVFYTSGTAGLIHAVFDNIVARRK